MSDPIQITRKNYWQVNGTNHSTEIEALQDAANQALAAPGTTIQVQPPGYDVVYTAPVTPPVVSPPVDPPTSGGGSGSGTPPDGPPEPPPTTPPSGAAPNIGAAQPGDPTWQPPDA